MSRIDAGSSAAPTDDGSNPHSSHAPSNPKIDMLWTLPTGIEVKPMSALELAGLAADPLDEVGGEHVVVVVRGGEAAAAAGERAQVDRVAQHLGGGDERFDDVLTD